MPARPTTQPSVSIHDHGREPAAYAGQAATAGEGTPKYPGIIADFGAHAAFIMGSEIPGWIDAGLEDVTVRGLINDKVTNEGTGAAVMGHPLNSLQWLAETLKERGKKLEAGDIATTGTTLGIIPVEPGATIKGDFGAFGTVTMVLGAS